MSSTDVPMYEFLLWSNCANSCKFCWQKKLGKTETLLTDDEMRESIAEAKKIINDLPFSDILIVGGEVFCTHTPEVDNDLKDLFEFIAGRIKEGKTRLMYANSNLIYHDLSVIESLIRTFDGMEDKLRLTTSYDIYGRYGSGRDRQLFQNNLSYLANAYPKAGIVVNSILTKQMCEAILEGKYDINEFTAKYHVMYVNLIPYIPVVYGDEMTASWNTIKQALMMIEIKSPHYIRYYVSQIDFKQPRTLREYRKGEGFSECTSKYLDCGHNANYTTVTGDGSCFCCKLRDDLGIFFDAEVLTDEILEGFVKEEKMIVTVGDTCSEYIWDNFVQPSVIVFDNKAKGDTSNLLSKVREAGVKRIVVETDEYTIPDGSNEQIYNIIHDFNGEKVAIQTTGEEDQAMVSCAGAMPKGSVLVIGDPRNNNMNYVVI